MYLDLLLLLSVKLILLLVIAHGVIVPAKLSRPGSLCVCEEQVNANILIVQRQGASWQILRITLHVIHKPKNL